MKSSASAAGAGAVAWVTGASGGLGHALVGAFLAAGWRVAAAGHSRPVMAGDPERCRSLRLDVTDPDSVRGAVRAILDGWGRVDVLVNNAGRVRDAAIAQLSDEAWEEVLDVNLTGAFRCAREVLPTMIAARRGHIINVSSIAAREGGRGQANYAAAKAGLIGLTVSLAREVGPDGICVNAVLPGMLRTRLIDGLSQEQVETQERRSVLNRLNTCDEAARFIVSLAGLDHLSGQVLALDARVGRWI